MHVRILSFYFPLNNFWRSLGWLYCTKNTYNTILYLVLFLLFLNWKTIKYRNLARGCVFSVFYLISAFVLVVFSCGHVFFRRSISTWLSGSNTIAYFKFVHWCRSLHICGWRSSRWWIRHCGSFLLQFVASGSSQSSSDRWKCNLFNLELFVFFKI